MSEDLLGGLPTTGMFDTPRRLYHSTLQFSPYEWEMVRETAAQLAGYNHSHMWGKMPKDQLAHDRKHYEKIMATHSPSVAAKLLDHEHSTSQGSGMFTALRHTIHHAGKNLPVNVSRTMPTFMSDGTVDRLPVFGNYSADVQQLGKTVDASRQIYDAFKPIKKEMFSKTRPDSTQ